MPETIYPHMGRADTYLWAKFLQDFPDRFQDYQYDVRVGRGTLIPDALEEPYRRMATALSQRRIDVLARDDGATVIIEVKPYPGISAVGQLLAYQVLYQNDHPDLPPALLHLICAVLDRDLRTVLHAQNITHTIVPLDAEELLALALP